VTTSIASVLAATPLGEPSLEELRGKPVAEVAREFEAMLVAQMIGAMRRTVGESGLLEASPERRVLDGFFDLELARSVLSGLDLGLARQLGAQLHEAQVPAPAATSAGLLPPVPGAEVSSGYGERLDPLTGEAAFHAGIDLAAPEGTPVRAAAAGAVVYSGARGAAGRMVEIEHGDGSRTRYAHLGRLHVAVGDAVAAGEVVGEVGTSGRTTGPHLHFAVESRGRAVDPELVLGPKVS
jgi:murein DD-endopeptidase MepM/ murein hydrolase activator NlpD